LSEQQTVVGIFLPRKPGRLRRIRKQKRPRLVGKSLIAREISPAIGELCPIPLASLTTERSALCGRVRESLALTAAFHCATGLPGI
jgi:hypothetical protein